MTNKHLSILGVVALVMIILTMVVTTERSSEGDGFVRGSYLVQGLDPQRVHAIYLERQGRALELKRSGEGFRISDKGGYPALAERVNHVFMTVTGVRVDELVTKNRENHAHLGVDGGEKSTIIRFLDKEGTPMVGVVVGTTRSDEQGIRSHVRLENDDRVYLSESILPFINTDFGGYISERLLDGDRSRYERLKVINVDGSVEIVRQDQGFAVAGVPPETDIDDAALEEVFNDVLDIRIKDILAANQADDVDFEGTLEIYQNNKIIYQISLGTREGRCFARVKAVGDFPRGEIVISREESDESLREKEAILLAAEAVERFNDLHRGWVYEVDTRYLTYIKEAPPEWLK